jgi:hypothetical protein
VVFILFYNIFAHEQNKKFIWQVFLLASVFPILLWLIPVILENPIISDDHLQRIIGPFKGFWYFQFYALQAIVCSLVLLTSERTHTSNTDIDHNGMPFFKSLYYRIKTILSVKTIVFSCIILISIVMVYKCYSKAGWIILLTIFVIWFLLKKKYLFAILLPIAITVLFFFVKPLRQDFLKTFDNEIGYFIEHTVDKENVFRGRLSWWESVLQDFVTSSLSKKIFGMGDTIDYTSSDYFLMLRNGGMLNLAAYLVLLGATSYYVLKRYFVSKNANFAACIIIVAMLLLASISTHPMMSPSFAWFMWGIIGIILSNRPIELRDFRA